MALGVSLVVGQRTLTPRAEVRALHPQPSSARYSGLLTHFLFKDEDSVSLILSTMAIMPLKVDNLRELSSFKD